VLPPPTSTITPAIDSVPNADAAASAVPIQPFALVAPWQNGAEIPLLNTCDGDDISPALSWTGVPDNTVELALVVTDDDAGGLFHWIVTSFDPAFGSMLEGQAPQGALQWPNSFGARAWTGPCPPPGTSHTYRFVLHALNQRVDEVAVDTPVDELLDVINAFTQESTTITGTYTR
jgi:Raf kinase inhibitor-like YbhB/YbcL family protein